MTEWTAKLDTDDGSWEVWYTSAKGLPVIVGYGLTEATARLVAAAPLMLEALQKSQVANNIQSDVEAHRLRIAAIEKATGSPTR